MLNKKEDKLQCELVLWYSGIYTSNQDFFFAIRNESKRPMYAKSVGVVPGVSDMMLLTPFLHFFGIELKAPMSKHSREKINRQIEWGRSLLCRGGSYIMTSDIKLMKNAINLAMNNRLDELHTICFLELSKVQEKLDKKTKTIRF